MLKKTAIAIDPSLLAEIDKAAEERGQSRNAFIGLILKAAVRAWRDRDVTRKLDAFFADSTLQRAQRADAAKLDDAGSDWNDERW